MLVEGIVCMSEWPAPAAALDAGRALLRARVGVGPVAIACDSDVDGLTSGLLFERAVQRLGGTARALVAARGEQPHTDSMRRRIAAAEPALLVVTDMGSRAGAIVPGVPTLLVDHHRPAGFPDGAVVVSAFGHPPIAASGVLAWELLRPIVAVEDLDWLAVLAAVADLGSVADFPMLHDAARRVGKTHTAKAVSLLNAARRAGRFQGEQAMDVLRAAAAPVDIALRRVPGTDALEACRVEVQAELARVSRTAPRFGKDGKVALLRFSSTAQIHPVVATKWATRLKGKIVVAANDGYLPGTVSFAMRANDKGTDLIELLRGLRLSPPVVGEFGYGHPQATGGRLAPDDFARVLAALTFDATAPARTAAQGVAAAPGAPR